MTVSPHLHPIQRPATAVAEVFTPGTIEEALAVLDRYRDRAKPIAGGTDLLIELDRAEHTGLRALVDLTRIEGLDTIAEIDGGRIGIGPLVTHNQCAVSEVIRAGALPLAQACWEVGSPQLRNRATVVGNVVTASPANDSISALAVLNAELTLESVDGRRTVSLAEFHTGVRKTVLEPNELVTGVTFDALGPDWKSVYVKLGLRKAQAISVVHLALALHVQQSAGRSTVTEARLALGSVAPVIVRAAKAEAELVGTDIDDEVAFTTVVDRVAASAASSVRPIDDIRSPAWYRSAQVEEMTRRALWSLAAPETTASPPSRPVTLAGSTGGRAITGRHFAAHHTGSDRIVCVVNGRSVSAPADAEAGTRSAPNETVDDGPAPGNAGVTLLDWLRDNGFVGTKEGCAEGECGACTVHLDGMAVLSCLVPATRVNGSRVTTIEGVAGTGPHDAGPNADRTGALHPLQQTFVECGAVQCGYCIPGFLMSGVKLLEESPHPTDDEIKAGLGGNLCRCTGYYRIETAVIEAARRLASQVPPSPGGDS
jgi:carbon-monoxide dehydrogenase medium subunit